VATLAELVNSPTDITFREVTYKLREPDLMERGRYQRWLEQEARASAAAATELQEEDRRNLLRDVNADVAAKRYAWGGEVCVESLRTPDGLAKLYAIVCESQGLTFEVAREMMDSHFAEIAAVLTAANAAAEAGDEEAKKSLGLLLFRLGRPANFLSTSSSASPTSSDPKRSSRSAGSAKRKSGKSTSRRSGTSTGRR
jgi:hypothetical protein